ncbi:MAG: hypothetical protein DLM73_08035 [Chthoniobacterales bacterium]|nr:MAG: hypothetical protein DLM73_08035 [Chthoniobacterales bacterium]
MKLTALSATQSISIGASTHNLSPSSGLQSSSLRFDSLANTGPQSATGIYETALREFPRPFDVFNPFLQTAPNRLEAAPWLTAPIAAARPYTGKGLADLLEASRLTQLTNNLVSPSLVSGPPTASPLFQRLLNDFESTSASYADLLRAAEVSDFNPALFAIPARGYFASGDTLVQVDQACSVPTPLQRTRESAREEASRRRESKLEALLSTVNADLCTLWSGAHLAAASDNPERIRYACVSVRELMTQVMHALAPTAKVLKWTSDPNQLHNGNPTRRARLLYICQSVTAGPLSEYMNLKIKSVAALADVVQKGTHEIGFQLSPLELQLMFNGAEEALCSLLEIGVSE